MARAVRWATSALEALDQAADHLHRHDPRIATRMVAEIDRVARGLGIRHTGRPGRVSGTFEKSVLKWRYVIAYQIQKATAGHDEEIVILHVVHTSRNWQKGQWPE